MNIFRGRKARREPGVAKFREEQAELASRLEGVKRLADTIERIAKGEIPPHAASLEDPKPR